MLPLDLTNLTHFLLASGRLMEEMELQVNNSQSRGYLSSALPHATCVPGDIGSSGIICYIYKASSEKYGQ